MRGHRLSLLGFVAALSVCPAVAMGQGSAELPDPDPAEFTPAGYEFCGWSVLGTSRWRLEWDDSLSGVYITLFARKMSCRVARKRYRRVHAGKRVPGYRCVTLKNAHEFSDTRCSKIGRKSVAFRVQTGA